MYAIIKTGGKQYKVAKDAIIDVELLDAEVGAQVEFKDVLMLSNGNDSINIGAPHVAGAIVVGELLDLVAGPKIKSVKYIPGNHRRKIGHRQHYSRVQIKEIRHQKQK